MADLPKIVKFPNKRSRRKYSRRYKASYIGKRLYYLLVLLLLLAVFTMRDELSGHAGFPGADKSGRDSGYVSGPATVTDGDTIKIKGQRIRLYGIDAPEKDQSCQNEHGENWRCGSKATDELEDQIGNDPISCRAMDIDRYDRVVAVCYNGDENLNKWMVRNGWAVAYLRYSTRYAFAEQQARWEKLGIWAGTFENPHTWRMQHRH